MHDVISEIIKKRRLHNRPNTNRNSISSNNIYVGRNVKTKQENLVVNTVNINDEKYHDAYSQQSKSLNTLYDDKSLNTLYDNKQIDKQTEKEQTESSQINDQYESMYDRLTSKTSLDPKDDHYCTKNDNAHKDTQPLIDHLLMIRNECRILGKSFWKYHELLSFYDSIITIPTIILTTVTGITSLSTISSLQNVTTVSAVIATLLSAIGKFFRYPERCEKIKSQAKTYDELYRHITVELLNRRDLDWTNKIVDDVHKKIDLMRTDVEEMPRIVTTISDKFRERSDQNEGHSYL